MVDMAMLTIPVIVVYFRAHGLSMQDVMLLQAIFAVTMVVIEIPSGYFSDVLGRKRTLFIGIVMALMGWTAYVFANTFTDFLVAEIILGVGASFLSGTDSAMLYDTLLELGHTERSVREEGKQLSFSNFAEAAAAVVGGLLAMISLHTPFVVQALWMLIPLPLVYLLVEPAEHRREGRTAGWKEITDIVTHVLRRDKLMRSMIVASSMLSASTLVMVWLIQPYWTTIAIPVGVFGILWASGNAIVGFASIRAHTIASKWEPLTIMTVLVASVALACIIAGLWPGVVGAVLFAAFYIARGVSNPLIISEINVRVDSAHRATVLSVRQLGMRLVFLIIAPFIGYIGDITSIPTAVFASGVVFAILGSIALLMWRRYRV